MRVLSYFFVLITRMIVVENRYLRGDCPPISNNGWYYIGDDCKRVYNQTYSIK
jgi:hypothetical protein